MTTNNKTVIVIAGPTAVGKTAVGIQVAQHFNTEIISADSRQCYKELRIGVARPSEEELATVLHHFIATHSIHDPVTAILFEQYALQKAEELFKTKDVIAMVGGTGLYIKAFCEGMDEIPSIPEEVRNNIVEQYYEFGLNWLQQQVQQSDPGFFAVGEIQNPQRLMRALEVFKATGKSILDFRKGHKAQRNFTIIKIALSLPKEQLHLNINQRVDSMIEEGLLAEVQSLLPYQHLNALQTVGYKELFAYYAQEVSLIDAIDKIKRNTRYYAKRQMTWFRKDKGYIWLTPHLEEVLSFITHQTK